MLQHPGQLIGDAWFFVHDNIIHCFYLTCPIGVQRHHYWDIGHAISTDMVNWTLQPLASIQGPAGTWDDGLATGSILRWQDRFWMAYCSCGSAQVGMAFSDDLFTWTKIPNNPVTDLDECYYEAIGSGTRAIKHWRDPFLWTDGNWVYHYVCASRREGKPDERGTIGLARTRNMTQWEVLPPPPVDPVAQELECPQLYHANGQYYLVFSTATDFFSARFLAQHTPAELGWSMYGMIAPTPRGPFRLVGTGRILPVEYPVQPYAGQLVLWQQHAYLLGTLVHPDGDAICDPIPVEFTAQGVRASGTAR